MCPTAKVRLARWQTMADFFLQLSPDERREALGVAAASSGRPIHLLDKDVWVVWVLEVLFQAPFATHLRVQGRFLALQGVPDHPPILGGCGSDLRYPGAHAR